MQRRGFTLIEMLVVIGIIGILIVALVPAVRGAQTKAKEVAVKTQAANIETALAAYAQNHGGNYPGVAIDIMSPYADHALGDPALYTGAPGNSYDATPGQLVAGMLGGFEHYNDSSTNVFEQLKNVKNTNITGNTGVQRYFDSLAAADAIQEYPPNPFVTGAAGERRRMQNIFSFTFDIANGFDPTANFSPGVSDPATAHYTCALHCQPGGTAGTTVPDTKDNTRLFLTQNPLPGGLPTTPFTPESFATQSKFGTDDNDYFAQGDFAYVPILSTSPYAFGDASATLENETYKWGTEVTGYMFFAYGDKKHKNREFADDESDFAKNGLPGYGSPGVDTIYENYALQCFEGAIYFHKVGF